MAKFLCSLFLIFNTAFLFASSIPKIARESIVTVTNEVDPQSFSFYERFKGVTRTNEGSGIIVGGQGLVLTCSKLVANTKKLFVTVWEPTKQTYPAKVLRTDPVTGLATLQIQSKNISYKPAISTDSDRLPNGAKGYLVNQELQTISSSIALTRINARTYVVTASGKAEGQFSDFKEIAIKPNGSIIGFVEWLPNQNPKVSQFGYLLPWNVANGILQKLKNGNVQHGFMGITFRSTLPKTVDASITKQNSGAIIDGITKNSPAYKAGLKKGDCITQMNNFAIKTERDLFYLFCTLPPKRDVKLTVIRYSKPMDITLKLDQRDQFTTDNNPVSISQSMIL
jgi:serine protease Do